MSMRKHAPSLALALSLAAAGAADARSGSASSATNVTSPSGPVGMMTGAASTASGSTQAPTAVSVNDTIKALITAHKDPAYKPAPEIALHIGQYTLTHHPVKNQGTDSDCSGEWYAVKTPHGYLTVNEKPNGRSFYDWSSESVPAQFGSAVITIGTTLEQTFAACTGVAISKQSSGDHNAVNLEDGKTYRWVKTGIIWGGHYIPRH